MNHGTRRFFRRYPKKTDLHVYSNNRTIRAETTDYSLTGVGAIIKNADIRKGEVISLSVREPQINTIGEVVWARNDREGIRIGIRNIGPLRGLLQDFRPDDTIIGIHKSQKSGTFTVESGNIVRKIFVKNGDLIFSSSNQDSDRLGIMLLNEGKITTDQYHRALAALRETGKRMGAVLVTLGFLEARELVSAVRRQVEEIILTFFTMNSGTFALDEKLPSPEELIALKLSAPSLVYRGVRRISNIDFIRGDLPPLDSIVQVSSDPLDLLRDADLDDDARRIISFVDGKTSLGDLVTKSRLRTSEALKTIYALFSVRMIEVSDEETTPEPSFEPPERVAEATAEGESEVVIDHEFLTIVEDTHKRLGNLGYYGVLGVKDYATAEEIKNAYYMIAKKFHPDMHFRVADKSLKTKLNEIFSYVCEAYATLSDPRKRTEYDKTLTLKPARLSSNEDKAQAFFEEGRQLFRRQDYAGAEQAFAQAVYFNNTVGEYHHYYGITLNILGKFREAQRALEKAISREPGNGTYHTELGFIFLNLGSPGRARNSFEYALKCSPGNAKALDGLSRLSAT